MNIFLQWWISGLGDFCLANDVAETANRSPENRQGLSSEKHEPLVSTSRILRQTQSGIEKDR
jgi:hypothetical protein